MGLESRLVSSDAPASALHRVARSVSPYRMLTVVEAHLDELVSADKRFPEVRADMRSMRRRGVGAEGASMRPPMISR